LIETAATERDRERAAAVARVREARAVEAEKAAAAAQALTAATAKRVAAEELARAAEAEAAAVARAVAAAAEEAGRAAQAQAAAVARAAAAEAVEAARTAQAEAAAVARATAAAAAEAAKAAQAEAVAAARATAAAAAEAARAVARAQADAAKARAALEEAEKRRVAEAEKEELASLKRAGGELNDRLERTKRQALDSGEARKVGGRRQVETAAQKEKRVEREMLARHVVNNTTYMVPEVKELREFERDVHVARLLMHYNSVGGKLASLKCQLPTVAEEPAMGQRWEGRDDVPERARALCAEIERYIVRDEVVRERVREYQDAMHYGSGLLSCGCCGVRDWEGVGAYHKREVDTLAALQLSEEQRAEWEGLREFRAACSVFVSKSGKAFYLHRELVEEGASGVEIVQLCASCVKDIDAGKQPDQSIAAGVDFGVARRLGLPALSAVEKMLISRVRLYSLVVKLRAPDGGGVATQCALSGHVISFKHDAPAVMATVFPQVDNVRELVKVKFVDDKGKWDRHIDKALRCKELTVRADVVYLWLRALAALNPWYKDVVIVDDVPTRQALGRLTAELVAAGSFITDSTAVAMDRAAGSDVAGVRTDGCGGETADSPYGNLFGIGEAPGDGEGEQAGGDGDAMMLDRVFVTNQLDEVGTSTRQALSAVQVLESTVAPEPAGGAGFPTSFRDGQQRQAVPVMRGDLVNEYGANDELLYGAFPDLFLLGRGLHAKYGVSDKHTLHMLRQFTGVFAHSQDFIFLLFDQKRRHKVAQLVATRVKNSDKAFEGFMNIANDPEFEADLKKAKADLTGQEAKKVMRRILPFINLVGRDVPYSPVERSQASSKLHAMVHRFGLPSIFLTIAPDDVNNPMAIRMSFPSSSNTVFPATPDGFLDALQKDQDKFDTIPISQRDLKALAADSPVACAEIFQRMLENVFKCLLNVQPEGPGQRKTVLRALDGSAGGVFGDVTAVFSVVEAQARGSLHAHMAIWGGVPPDLLQRVGAYPALVERVSRALDSMFHAELPVETHIESVLRREERQPPHHFVREMAPDPGADAAGFVKKAHNTVETCGLHLVHTHTCAKGDGIKCRLSKPSGLTPCTGVVQLEVVPCEGRTRPNGKPADSVIVREGGVEEEDHTLRGRRDMDKCPVAMPDVRHLFWELQRRKINVSREEAEATVPPHIREKLEALTPEQWAVLAQKLHDRNGTVVEFNIALSAVLGCNTAAYILGGVEQAKGALFYLVDYITKNPCSIDVMLSVAHDAKVHIRQNPSTADDTGTVERTARHFAQRIANNLCGMVEFSAQQAAACVLGMPSSMCTTAFSYCFVWPAMKYVADKGREHGRSELAGAAEDDSDSDSEEEREADVGDHAEVCWADMGQDAAEGGAGSSSVFSTGRGQAVPVPQHLHYAHRGVGLEVLSLYEYSALVSVVEKKKKKGSEKPPQPEGKRTAGRPANQTYEFSVGHPLRDTHVQQLRSKQCTPILAGKRPPSYPGPMPEVLNRAWERAAAAYARYVLLLFKPWNVHTGMPEDLSWAALCKFMTELERPDACFVSKSTVRWIENVTYGLKTDAKRVWASCAYRTRCAGLLHRGRQGGRGDGAGEEDADAVRERDVLRREINDLRDQASMRPSGREATAALTKGYVNNTLASLDSLCGNAGHGAVSGDGACEADTARADGRGPRRMHSGHASAVVVRDRAEPTVQAVWADLRLGEEDTGGDGSRTTGSGHGGDDTDEAGSRVRVALTAEQSGALEEVLVYVRALQAWRLDQSVGERPVAPLTLIHGGPGVGKTTFINELYHQLKENGSGVVCAAFTGIAAGGCPQGNTLHKVLEFGMSSGSHGHDDGDDRDLSDSRKKMNTALQPLNFDRRALMEKRFEGSDVFLIDEVSMVNPILLGHVNQRLCELSGNAEPFGGKCVLICGDFFQLPPTVPKTPLFKVALLRAIQARLQGDTSPQGIRAMRGFEKCQYAIGTPGDVGGSLFDRFRLVPFAVQKRAEGDPVQKRNVEQLRDVSVEFPVTAEVINSMRVLTAEDVAEDPGWTEAPIVVTSNHERVELNYVQAKRYAARHGLPFFSWRVEPSKRMAKKLTATEWEAGYAGNREMHGYFVKGAPAYLTYNISTARGLSNGTFVHMHSLTFDGRLAVEAAAMVERATGGEIELPCAPASVNVWVPVEDSVRQSWPPELTLVPGEVVIPVLANAPTPDKVELNSGRVVSMNPHTVDLGFSLTFHKVQGATLPYVILELNKRAFKPYLDFHSLYVGLTRVRQLSHLRILPCHAGATLDHLLLLKPPMELKCWLAGFDDDGHWDGSVAAHAYFELLEGRQVSKRARREAVSQARRERMAQLARRAPPQHRTDSGSNSRRSSGVGSGRGGQREAMAPPPVPPRFDCVGPVPQWNHTNTCFFNSVIQVRLSRCMCVCVYMCVCVCADVRERCFKPCCDSGCACQVFAHLPGLCEVLAGFGGETEEARRVIASDSARLLDSLPAVVGDDPIVEGTELVRIMSVFLCQYDNGTYWPETAVTLFRWVGRRFPEFYRDFKQWPRNADVWTEEDAQQLFTAVLQLLIVGTEAAGLETIADLFSGSWVANKECLTCGDKWGVGDPQLFWHLPLYFPSPLPVDIHLLQLLQDFQSPEPAEAGVCECGVRRVGDSRSAQACYRVCACACGCACVCVRVTGHRCPANCSVHEPARHLRDSACTVSLPGSRWRGESGDEGARTGQWPGCSGLPRGRGARGARVRLVCSSQPLRRHATHRSVAVHCVLYRCLHLYVRVCAVQAITTRRYYMFFLTRGWRGTIAATLMLTWRARCPTSVRSKLLRVCALCHVVSTHCALARVKSYRAYLLFYKRRGLGARQPRVVDI